MSEISIRVSSLPRLLTCPGSRTLIRLIPATELRETAVQHEGTMLHWLVAKQLADQYGAVPGTEGLDLSRPRPDGVPADYELPEAALWPLRSMMHVALEAIPGEWSLQVEVEMSAEGSGFVLTGHADVLGINAEATEAVVIDWKTGFLFQPPAEHNWQMAGYMALAVLTYPTLERVRAVVYQPRAFLPDGAEQSVRLTEVVLEGEELRQLPTKLWGRVQAALAEPDLLQTSAAGCRYCPAIMRCPAMREELRFMRLRLTELMTRQMEQPLSTAELADVAARFRTLDVLREACEETLKERLEVEGGVTLEDGTVVNVVNMAGRPEILDAQAIYQTLNQMLPPESMAEAFAVKITEARKALAQRESELTGKKVPVDSKDSDKTSGASLFRQHCGQFVRPTVRRVLQIS